LSFVELCIRYLYHELADLVIQGVEGQGGVSTKSTLKATLVMLAASTKSNKTPVELGSRGERFDGRCSSKAGISNVEDLEEVVSGGRTDVQSDVLCHEGVDHSLEGWG
jgi:hypothetical protein